MLTITLPRTELFDNKKQEFVYIDGKTIQMEHSLVSISKWESRWNVPFISDEPRAEIQKIDYYICMTITQNVTPMDFRALTPELQSKIEAYIAAPMTATILPPPPKRTGKKEVVTSEKIYAAMIANKIPFECQKWHLNRLITLIQLCSEQNTPPKKASPEEIAAKNRRINEANRLKYKSRG